MTTHCFIGYEKEDGTVKWIELESDGYPAYVMEYVVKKCKVRNDVITFFNRTQN